MPMSRTYYCIILHMQVLPSILHNYSYCLYKCLAILPTYPRVSRYKQESPQQVRKEHSWQAATHVSCGSCETSSWSPQTGMESHVMSRTTSCRRWVAVMVQLTCACICVYRAVIPQKKKKKEKILGGSIKLFM